MIHTASWLLSSLNREIFMAEQEYDYPESYNLISVTDPSSKIKYASPHFNEVAGYQEGELVGEYHNVVRHSDMPKAAFKTYGAIFSQEVTGWGMVEKSTERWWLLWVDAFASPLKEITKLSSTSLLRFKTQKRIR
eukprot:TRINITY_DN8687_c0_g1_i1.p1 TRINITY_DN8687_c0_g1~~TRINITY_DN8687_c0_g1_i1.p1  ORF type:complete len:135 (+),score=1.06 TRINITY_DN8687_c0_g1_i1:230-634(+)